MRKFLNSKPPSNTAISTRLSTGGRLKLGGQTEQVSLRQPNGCNKETGKTRANSGQNIFRLQTGIDLQYERIPEAGISVPYRDAVCTLCEKTVSLALSVPLSRMQSKTRCSAEIALARQIAMYLCHTMFSILLTEVGLHFKRDRTTVSYACALIEDKRDEPVFDLMITQLESLLTDARHAMSICVEHETESIRKAHIRDTENVCIPVHARDVHVRAGEK